MPALRQRRDGSAGLASARLGATPQPHTVLGTKVCDSAPKCGVTAVLGLAAGYSGPALTARLHATDPSFPSPSINRESCWQKTATESETYKHENNACKSPRAFSLPHPSWRLSYYACPPCFAPRPWMFRIFLLWRRIMQKCPFALSLLLQESCCRDWTQKKVIATVTFRGGCGYFRRRLP